MSTSRKKNPFSNSTSGGGGGSRPSSRASKSSKSGSRNSTPTPSDSNNNNASNSNNDLTDFFQDPRIFQGDVIDGAPPPMSPVSANTNNANSTSSTATGGGKGHVRKKSITSGISTLFRRQPSPDPYSMGASDSDSNAQQQQPQQWFARARTRTSSIGSQAEASDGSNHGRSPSVSRSTKSSKTKNSNTPPRSSSSSKRGLKQPPRSTSTPPDPPSSAPPAAGGSSSSAFVKVAKMTGRKKQEIPVTTNNNSNNNKTNSKSKSKIKSNKSTSPSVQDNDDEETNMAMPSFQYTDGTDDDYTRNGLSPTFTSEGSETYFDGDTATYFPSESQSLEYDYDEDDDDESDGHTNNNSSRRTGYNDTNNKNNNTTTKYKKKRSKTHNNDTTRLPRRYRGFSTSISSLFLDESIVCGALSCCGLLLSSRTEHLLNERNVKRGLTRRGSKQGGSRAPSRILGMSLLGTIVMVVVTYVVWGFGNQYVYDNEAGYTDDNVSSGNGNNNGGANNYNNNVERYANNDDGKKNYYDDAVDGAEEVEEEENAADVDDGVQDANDDAAQQADDAAAAAGDDAAAQDYYGNRKLDQVTKVDTKRELLTPSSPKKKHAFSGIMKMRDYREHVIDPVFGIATRAYSDLMGQFEEDNIIGGIPSTNKQITHRNLGNNNSSDEDIGSQARTVIIVVFLFMLGVVGRRRRMRTRFAILRSRAQDDHLYYASLLTNPSGSLATPDGTVMENFHEREDKYDGACSHTLFGCYPVDNQSAYYADYDDNDDDDSTTSEGQQQKKRKGGDFMNRTMDAVFSICCGIVCKCWCQVFSICALAQEAREARLLLPPKMQRIDLLTHQPFHEYAKDVNDVRRRFMTRASRTWLQHYAALSLLSRYILLGFLSTVLLVTMTMLLHGGFAWGDAMVLVATFVQSFLVLMVVFGIFHRSDLSLDAVIKFFAVGFVICVPVGFVLEGLVINGSVTILYGFYYFIKLFAGESFDAWIIDNHYVLWFVGELFNAYFVAALVEELCKYYGFRFIEHPDLLFLTGLDRSAQQTQTQGGKDAYKYDSQIVSDFSRSLDDDSDENKRRRKRDQNKLSLRKKDGEDDEEPELRTLQQQAAAITTGMISVAVGLTCAENFLYVFFIGGSSGDLGSVGQEVAVLLFRSIFPVHALAAAMQSINMIHKFIEQKHTEKKNIGVGRIIFPAVLLHGTFDAILMSINAYIEAKWDRYYEENDDMDDDAMIVPYNAALVNMFAWVGIIGVMAVSFGWYTLKNQYQMLALARIEQKSQPRSKRGGFDAPNLV